MTLDLDSLKLFVKVAELGNLTRAGAQLGVSKARVSTRLTELEESLGCRLFHRTTRLVRLTPEGDELLPRARRFLAEGDELGAMFQSTPALRGVVRLDLPVNIARSIVVPRLGELFARHPGLELVLSTTDRRVDAVREGFDCVLRVGPPVAPGLVGRRLMNIDLINAASPAYLQRHGVPRTLDDLERHFVVHYSSTLDASTPSFEHPVGDGYAELPMKSFLTVNSADTYLAAAIAGLGIIQSPRSGLAPSIAAGLLVEVLPELRCAPMAVSILHTHGRSVPRRVRAVIDWLVDVLRLHGTRI